MYAHPEDCRRLPVRARLGRGAAVAVAAIAAGWPLSAPAAGQRARNPRTPAPPSRFRPRCKSAQRHRSAGDIEQTRLDGRRRADRRRRAAARRAAAAILCRAQFPAGLGGAAGAGGGAARRACCGPASTASTPICFMARCCATPRRCRRSSASCCCPTRFSPMPTRSPAARCRSKTRMDDEDLTPEPVDVVGRARHRHQQPRSGGGDRGAGAAIRRTMWRCGAPCRPTESVADGGTASRRRTADRGRQPQAGGRQARQERRAAEPAAADRGQSRAPALAAAQPAGRPGLGQYRQRAARALPRRPAGLHHPRRRRRDRQADPGIADRRSISLLFNPPWNVPYVDRQKEILPADRRTPIILSRITW